MTSDGLHAAFAVRNVTITGAPGQLPVLDLGSAPGVLAICSTCTFRIANLALANESAQGTTSGSSAVVSVLQGRAGSKVEVEGVFGLRAACLPTAASLAILNNTQRSPLFPRPGGQQLVNSTEVTYEVRRRRQVQVAAEICGRAEAAAYRDLRMIAVLVHR